MDVLQPFLDFLGSSIVLGSLELPFSWLKLIAAILLLVLGFIVYKLLMLALRRVLRAIQVQERVEKSVLRWTRIVLRILYLGLIFILVGWLFGARMLEYIGSFLSVLGEPLIASGSTSISFLTLLLTIPVFYIASWAGRSSRSLLDRALLKRMGLDESRKFSIASLVRYSVMVVVVLIGLSFIGIDLSALAVLFGVLGIGVGFGLQSVVANFFSGLIIILTRPIKENDRIEVNQLDATVIQIRLLSTVINTVTNETIIIPNSHLVNNTVHNYSYDNRSIIITNDVSVSYDTDLDEARVILLGIANDNPFKTRIEPEARVTAFEDSGIGMKLLTSIGDVSDKYQAQSWTNLEIWRRFKTQGIEIPFPQVDLHVKDGLGSLGAGPLGAGAGPPVPPVNEQEEI